MPTLQHHIDAAVTEALARDDVIDVCAVAKTVHSVFPKEPLDLISKLVGKAVLAKKGNANWN